MKKVIVAGALALAMMLSVESYSQLGTGNTGGGRDGKGGSLGNRDSMRKEMEIRRTKAKELRELLNAKAKELREAVKNGTMTPEEAKRAMQEYMKSLKANRK